MRLFLIRHAESENNARPPYERVDDPSITAVGRLQAEALAQWTKSLSIDVLITSPFRRSLQTGRIVKDAAQPRHVMVWHDVFEQGGCYAGHSDLGTQGRPGLGIRSILNELPAAVIDETIAEDGWWGGKPKETDEDAELRAAGVIRRLVEVFGQCDRNIVAILHADFIRTLLAQMLHPLADATQFGPLRNTGISKVDFEDGHWRLDWFNSVTHLPVRLITGVEW